MIRKILISNNKTNQDLLVAGYGQLDFNNKSKGYVLFWSLKNPTHPHKYFEMKSSVVSLDFCLDRPNLLAVGMYDKYLNKQINK